jgi:uncharacterized membrane protein
VKKRKNVKPRNAPETTEPKSETDPQAIPPEVLEKLPEGTRTANIQAASFSGPLPPPALFGEYDNVLPGSAERILRMTEREQEQRHGWDNRAITIQGGEIKRGQWLGFFLGALLVAGAVYCASIGEQWVAIAMAGTSLVSIVTAFIKGRSNDESG